MDLIKPILKRIIDGKPKGKKEDSKMIINLLEKIEKMKDKGNTIRNERFKAVIQHEYIK